MAKSKIIKKAVKKTVKKKVISPDEVLFVLGEDSTLINWRNIPSGSKCSFHYGTKTGTGRICKFENNVFICQDIANHNTIPNSLGYKYASYMSSASCVYGVASYNGLIVTKIVSPEKDYKLPEILMIGEYAVSIYPGYITVGCKKITNEKVLKIADSLIKK